MDKQYDVVIVGTGVAGLYGALQYSEDVKVLLLSKKELTLSNSSLAQGGVAAVLDTSHNLLIIPAIVFTNCILPILLLQENIKIICLLLKSL